MAHDGQCIDVARAIGTSNFLKGERKGEGEGVGGREGGREGGSEGEDDLKNEVVQGVKR